MLNGPITIQAIECQDRRVETSIEHATASSTQDAVVHLRVSPEKLDRGTIVLKCITSRETEQVLDLPLLVRPVLYLEAKPAAVYLGVLNAEELAKREIAVSVEGALLRHLRFARVECPGYLSCRRVSPRVGSRMDFLFGITDKVPGAALSDELRIVFVLDEREISLEVPVSGFVDLEEGEIGEQNCSTNLRS